MNTDLTTLRTRWLALGAATILLVVALTAGTLFAANERQQSESQLLPRQSVADAADSGRAADLPPAPPAPERVPAQPDDNYEEETDLPPIVKTPPQYPNLDSNLNRLVDEASSAQETRSADGGASPTAEPVLVTFYIEPERVADVRQYLETNGVFVRNVGEDYIEAHVPPSMLGAASEQPGILRVDTVIPPRPAQSQSRAISQGVDLHAASDWHTANYRGQGIKVGVIDRGFEGLRQLQGNELPSNVTARCYFQEARAPSSRVVDCDEDGDHGTAVSDTLVDVAPSVELYIANPFSNGDLRNAVEWMAGQGVQVINYSVGKVVDGPGDGTSPFSDSPLRTIDAAVSRDITWINAAGNNAQQVWYGTFLDPDNDGVHNFAPRDQGNTFRVREGERLGAFMRWDDSWGQADCDLDLLLTKRVGNRNVIVIVDDIEQDGNPGSIPRAAIFTDEATASQAGLYALWILKFECADDPAWIQLTMWDPGSLEHYSPGHHMGNPEESRSAGTMAVGATHYWDTQSIASYSSRGPTIDGRTKPEITGVACGESTVVPPSVSSDGSYTCWFRGTSQAAPHVAGLAALIRQRFPDYGPSETVRYLQQHASDRGTAGADNTWGHGLATLPVPEVTPTGTVQSSTLTRLMNVRAVSNVPGELAITWEGGDNADSYLLIAVNLQDTTDYKTATVLGDAAKAGIVVGLTSGGSHLVIVVALQATEAGLETLYGTAGPVPVQTGASPPTADREALVALYHATGGANWADNTNWLSDGPVGDWHGVTTDAEGRVTELSLPENELMGEIPSELGNLSSLELLVLDHNQLGGSIPSQLGNLSNLTNLNLGFNKLTRTIPSELQNLSNLEELRLVENQLSGDIPTELGSLSNLEVLNLGDNRLTGTIPTQLQNLSNLKQLYLWNNKLKGDVPTWLGSLSNLERLALSINELSGPIPPSLGNLSNLTFLTLGGNDLTGTIPSQLQNLSKLEELRLWENDLDGSVPTWLGNLTNLTYLNLGGNELEGDIPAELQNLSKLEELYLYRNDLGGSIPVWLGSMTTLQVLHLGGTELEGDIPVELQNLSNLVRLDLGHNQLSETVPTWIGTLSELAIVSLTNNKLTGPIPPQLGNLAKLRELSLSRNQLDGSIPSSLGGLSNLEGLWLYDNQLDGSIPASLSNLTKLTLLRIAGTNQFTGCIPAGLSSVARNDLADLGLPGC